MATQNIGPKISIDGYSKYKADMRAIIAQTKELEASEKNLEGQYNKGTSAATKYKNQQQILTQKIAAQEQAVKLNAEMLDKVENEYGTGSTEAARYRAAVLEATTELNRMKEELKQIPTPAQQAGEALQKAGDKMKGIGEKITGVGQKMTASVTAPIVALGTAAAKTTIDFEQTMAQVQALSGVGSDDLSKLTKTAKDLGATTSFTASQVGEGMSYMALAGWKTEDMLDGIAPMLDLAAASGTDLGTASDIVTDALTAFGLTAKDTTRFVDVMAQTSSNSNTTVEAMGEAFKYVAPLAGAMGYSIEDVSLALGIMANSGIKGSAAGTALRSTISRLAKPTKEVAITMAELGISMTDEQGNMKSLDELLGDLRTAFSGLDEAQAAAAATSLAGKNAMSGFLALVKTGDGDFKKLKKAIENSNGAAKRMADTMLDTTQGAITIMQSAIEGAAISIGEELTPYIKTAADKVTKLATAFTNMDDATRDVVIKTAAMAALAGPLAMGLGAVVSSVGNITDGAGKLIKLVTAHPLGAALSVAAAVAGWGAMQLYLQGARSRTSELTKEIDGIRSSIKTTNDALATNKENLDKVITGADGNAEAAKRLIDKLEVLTAKEHLSNAEKAEMAAYVDALNELYPELNLQIDESGEKLNKTTREMRAYVDAMKAQAKAEGVKDAYVEAVRLQTQAQVDANRAQEAYNKVAEKSAETERERKLLQAQVTGLTEDRTQAEKELNDLLSRGVITADDYNKALTAMGDGQVAIGDKTLKLSAAQKQLIQSEGNHISETNKARAAMNEANAALEAATNDVNALDAAYEASIGDYNRATEASERAAESFSDTTKEITASGKAMDKHAEYFANMTGDEWELASTFVAEVESMNEALGKSIESQMDMFTQFSKGAEISKEEILANMQSQIDGVRNWEQNIDTLMHRGVDINILRRLIEMGPQGSSYVEAFVNMSDDELKKAGALWTESLAIKTMTDDWGETLKTDAATAVSTGMDGVPDQMKGYGTDSASEYIAGFNEYEGSLAPPELEEGAEEEYFTAGQTAGSKYSTGVADGEKAPTGLAAIKAAAAKVKEATAPKGVYDQNKGYGEQSANGTIAGIKAKLGLVRDAASLIKGATAPKGVYKQNEGYGEQGTKGVAVGMITPAMHREIMASAGKVKAAAAPTGIFKFLFGYGEQGARGTASGLWGSTAKTEVGKAAGSLKVGTALTGIFKFLFGYGEQGAKGTASGMTSKEGKKAVTDAAGKVKTASAPKGIFDFLKGYGTQGAKGTASGMTTGEGKKAVTDAAGKVKTASAPTGIFDQNKGYGSQGAQGVASGILSNLKPVTDAADDLKDASKPTGTYTAGKTAGENTVDGFRDGLANTEKIEGVGGVKAKARALAEAALKALNAKLDTGSPSKETRWIGQMAGEGFALGLMDEKKAVMDASADLFSPATFGSASFDVNGNPVGGNTYGDTSVVLNVYGAEGQDVRELADIVEQKIALNMRNRSAVWA